MNRKANYYVIFDRDGARSLTRWSSAGVIGSETSRSDERLVNGMEVSIIIDVTGSISTVLTTQRLCEESCINPPTGRLGIVHSSLQ
jgi:RecA/RadA recombinase